MRLTTAPSTRRSPAGASHSDASSSHSPAAPISRQAVQRRRSPAYLLVFALTALLALSALPAVAAAASAEEAAPAAAAEPHPAQQHHHQQHAHHNQVHAAHVKHQSKSSATSSKLPSSSSSAAAASGKQKKKLKAAQSQLAQSNKLGAVMHKSAEGTRIFSVNQSATELVGSGVDTIYSSNATACSRHYTVVDTDTCDIIGHKTHTSTYQIMALNLDRTDPDCHSLQTGMRLCLGRFGSDCQLVHRVRGEETCNDLIRRYDISRAVLLENNPNLSCRNIYAGLNLCVAPGRIAPPAPEGMYIARRSLPEDDE